MMKMNEEPVSYNAKLLSGKTFTVFQPIAKVFPLNHLLRTVHDGHGLMHRVSFPVNSVFCAQARKFSHSKVLPYTVLFCKYRARAVMQPLRLKPSGSLILLL